MRILGIDPGLTGGAAILVTGGDLDGFARCVDAIDIPTDGEGAKRRVHARHFAEWIRAGFPDRVYIERAQAMPNQGSSSGFIYGRATGALEAVVFVLGLPLEIVDAQVWKKHFGLAGKTKVADSKEQARRAALALMPSAEQWLARKLDHGRAEALLIAMYGADQWAAGR